MLHRDSPRSATTANAAPGVWLPLRGESAAEKGLTLLLVAGVLSAVFIGLASSYDLVKHWDAFQNGISTLLK